MISLSEIKDFEMVDDEEALADNFEQTSVEEVTKPITVEEVTTPTTEAEALLDVEVEITIVLGISMMPIAHVLKLGRGAVIELDRGVDEDIEVHANNRAVAKGEIVVFDDRLGITMTEIIKTSI